MVDVDHVVLADQGAALVPIHRQQILRPHGRGPPGQRPLQDLLPILGTHRTLPIHQHRRPVAGDLQPLVGQERRHAELRVARQQRQRRFDLGVVAILLADQAQQFLADLVAHPVGDDDEDLIVPLQERPDEPLEEVLLWQHRSPNPCRGKLSDSTPRIKIIDHGLPLVIDL